jgi:transposase
VSKEAFTIGFERPSPRSEQLDRLPDGQTCWRLVGFPRFKSRRRITPSVWFTDRSEADRMHVVLPGLGRLKLQESARKLARRLQWGTARIMSAAGRRDVERRHVSFAVEVERVEPVPARPGSAVVVDVGVKHLAV